MTFPKSGVQSTSIEIAVCGFEQKKGPQLALEPLDGRGIAGYVPKP